MSPVNRTEDLPVEPPERPERPERTERPERRRKPPEVLARHLLASRTVLVFGPKTEKEEAEQAAVHALAVGHQGAILLEEDSAWGRRIGEAFSLSFEAGGGRVVERRRFDRSEADHSGLLEAALGFQRSAERASRLQSALGRQLNYDPVMRADADFVFLAGRDQDVRLIKPQLTYVGAGHLPVFGTSRLYAGLRGAGGAGDLDGVEFPIAPWFVPGLPQGESGRRAQSQYADLSNPTLSQLHALGRDALGLVPWLDFMSDDPDLYLPGMTGRLHMSDDGRLEQELEPLIG